METTKIFKSPQTESAYVLVTNDERMFVGVRLAGVDPIFGVSFYRITLRGDEGDLAELDHLEDPSESGLSTMWSELKDGDHRSAIVPAHHLISAIDEIIPVVKDAIGEVNIVEDWQETLKAQPVPEIQCPICGGTLKMDVPEEVKDINTPELQ